MSNTTPIAETPPASPYGTLPPASPPASRKPVSLPRLADMHARGEKIAMLTAYDATFAALLDEAGVDTLLVGDSLGNVIQGRTTTLPVTLEHMVYHTECVARVQPAAWLIADMPFGSYENGKGAALDSAVALMRAGARMVKIEGGGWTTEIVSHLVARGIPVCAHLGLTPQSVHALGGYRIQGRTEQAVDKLLREARDLADAGATMLVLELVPSAVAAQVQQALPGLMVIGIGAGNATAGQVLVTHDMLGLTRGKLPRFVRNFLGGSEAGAGAGSVEQAVRDYVQAVKTRAFPDEALHGYR